MEYQKVGRGGAGNFYTPQDVEKASNEKTRVKRALAVFAMPRSRLSRMSKPSAMLPVEDLKISRARIAEFQQLVVVEREMLSQEMC